MVGATEVSGVGEGGAGGATAPLPPPPTFESRGAVPHCPPTLGHGCTIKRRKDFFMQYVGHSSYLDSIEAIARLIYIYETTVKQIFASDCTNSCLRAQKYQNLSSPRPP